MEQKPHVFIESAIRRTRRRYILTALGLTMLVLLFLCFVFFGDWILYKTLLYIGILGIFLASSLYGAIDRPRRLSRLLFDQPERILRGYIEYRLAFFKRFHLTYLHLIDDQKRNHVLTAEDATLMNLIEEIKRVAPQIDWNSPSIADDMKG